jgi:neutral ceramidase
VLELPLQSQPSKIELTENIAKYKDLLAHTDPVDKVAQAMLAWAEESLAQLESNRLPHSVPAEVQVIRLGDIALVGVPGELFVELGLAIKRDSRLDYTFICGFANGNVGYIPTRYAYARGGYEINAAFKYYGYPTALAPEAGEQVVATAVRLICDYG